MGADRAGIVEIEQHGRVAHHGQQQIVEAAGHMGADRLALEGAGKAQHDRPDDGDGEMIGPESDEAFAQRLPAFDLGQGARRRLLHILGWCPNMMNERAAAAAAGWGFT